MNAIFKMIERLVVGPVPDSLDNRVLDFRNGKQLTERDLMQGTLVLGSVGKGKSTLGRTLMRGMLEHGFGGLVMVVKKSQIEDAREICSRAGRARDCLVFSPGAGHTFNPLQGVTDVSDATDLLVELSEVLSASTGKSENESFWKEQLQIVLKNLFTLCEGVSGRFDLLLAADLFDGRASTPTQVVDPSWLQRSNLAKAVATLRPRGHEPGIRLAIDYFVREFPTLGDRLQGSLSACVSGIFDRLRRAPLCDLFTGESTFSMGDILNGGRILVVGMPALESVDGRIANGLLQFVFCRSATRIERTNNAFLFSDEAQETITSDLMKKVAVLREFRVAPVLLSQNLAVLDHKIGETAREGLCGLLSTKIFCSQSHADTRQWASEQIGKVKTRVETKTKGTSSGKHGDGRNSGTSTQEIWDYRVQPTRFSELSVGETICLRDGVAWLARWHRTEPGKSGTVRIA